MTLIQLVVLAIIQGITEFLPISSSAHLILAPIAVKDWQDQGALIDIAAHVGSLVAVLLYFRVETAKLFRGGMDTVFFRASDDRKLFLFIAVATVPTLLLAGVFVTFGISDMLRSPFVIGCTSIIFGLLLWHGDRSKGAREGLDTITWRDVLSIGAAQMIALIPGVSRSGITMTVGRYLGLSRPEAARFSMLLAIPTILALGFFAAIKIAQEGAGADMISAFVVAVLSFICAFASIAFLMRLTQKMSFTPFVIYRVIFGILLLVFAGQLMAA
ncbi:undecaprenyl-diphosphate phosphatase [Hyphococcus sp. DH-69]|uniref:undecaprenyl-diphosphate phosphatase n=1 Tax=Hyphococcus formosus TaxID=3143534 RepID=UPI00398B8304